MVQQLLDACADRSATNDLGETPVDWAKRYEAPPAEHHRTLGWWRWRRILAGLFEAVPKRLFQSLSGGAHRGKARPIPTGTMLRRSAAEHPGQILKRHTIPGAALSRWAGSLTRGLSRSAGPCWGWRQPWSHGLNLDMDSFVRMQRYLICGSHRTFKCRRSSLTCSIRFRPLVLNAKNQQRGRSVA